MNFARLLTAAALLATAHPALADDASEAVKAIAKGKELYRKTAGVKDKPQRKALYTAALKQFRRGYELDQKADYLFNVAQTHRFLHGLDPEADEHCPSALAAYVRVYDMVGTGSDEPASDLERITKDQIAELSEQCEASDEFPPVRSSAGDDDEEGDDDDDDTRLPPPGGERLGDDSWPGGRKAYLGVTIGATVLAAGLGGYALYELVRTRRGGHFDREFADAKAAQPFPSEDGDDLCNLPQITPGPKNVCDDAEAALLRRGIAAGTAGGFAVAAIVFAYLTVSYDSGNPSEKRRTSLESGPGDVGLSVSWRF